MTTPTPPTNLITLEDVEEFAKTLKGFIKVEDKNKNVLVFNVTKFNKAVQFKITQTHAEYDVSVMNSGAVVYETKTTKPVYELRRRSYARVISPTILSRYLLKLSSCRDMDYVSNCLNAILASLGDGTVSMKDVKSDLEKLNIKHEVITKNSLKYDKNGNEVTIKLIKTEFYCKYTDDKKRTNNTPTSTDDPIEFIKDKLK